MESDPALPPSPVDDHEAYVGLPLEEARSRAYQKGWRRVRAVTGDTTAVTMEWVVDRINFVVVDGHVTSCWFH